MKIKEDSYMRTLPVPRHASGPDLTMMFLGSEGTLGVYAKTQLVKYGKLNVKTLNEIAAACL